MPTSHRPTQPRPGSRTPVEQDNTRASSGSVLQRNKALGGELAGDMQVEKPEKGEHRRAEERK